MTQIIHSNPRFDVVLEQRPNNTGDISDFYYVSKPDAVVILATYQSSILFLEAERVNLDGIGLELPGGRIDPGEEPMIAARRELEEETGIVSSKLTLFASTSPLPSVTNERVHAFFVEIERLPSEILGDLALEEGISGWRLIKFEQVWKLCQSGKIGCSVDGYFSLLLANSKTQ